METKIQAGEHVLYLYGVIPQGQLLPTSEAAGLLAIPLASVVALVEPVPAGEFSSQVLEAKLQHVEWVTALARKHTAVLDEAMEHGPVVPARLCTLFTSAEALQRSLAPSEEQFQDKLERIRDRQEWGFKVFCDKEKLRATLGASDDELQRLEAAAARATPGQAYVLRKKREGRMAELVRQRLDEVADEVLDVLELLAEDTRARPLLSEAVSGRREAMALNAAVLIGGANCTELIATADALATRFGGEGFSFDPTGPWPPYSFCDDEDTASEDEEGLASEEP